MATRSGTRFGLLGTRWPWIGYPLSARPLPELERSGSGRVPAAALAILNKAPPAALFALPPSPT